MKIEKEQRWIVIIFMLGFLLGIIYANMMAGQYVTVTSVFHESYLMQYWEMEKTSTEYVWYLFQYRMLPYVGIAVLASTRYKKIASILVITWTGFSIGVLTVTAVLSMGATGIFICLAALFPHFILYGISYLIILWFCIGSPDIKWNRTKTCISVLAQIAGILTESYINPCIMKMIIGLILRQ